MWLLYDIKADASNKIAWTSIYSNENEESCIAFMQIAKRERLILSYGCYMCIIATVEGKCVFSRVGIVHTSKFKPGTIEKKSSNVYLNCSWLAFRDVYDSNSRLF